MPTLGLVLDEEDDGWYFTLFRDQFAHELSPYYRSDFWSVTSLRDSMVNRCIRHSVLSIGAYARALKELRDENPWNPNVCRPWWPPTVLNRHHQAALVHHAKALSHLRSEIEIHGIDSRLTMAATLLFIVFENLQGNYHSSGNLIRSGIKVLTNMQRPSSNNLSTLRRHWHSRLSVQRDEVDEMTDLFARHSITYAYIPFAHGKFAYHILFTEDEEHEDYDYDLAEPYTLTIPQTLEQARRTWDYFLPQLANFHNKAVWHNLNPDYDFDDAALFREQAIYLAQLQDFGLGLDALLYSPLDARESQGLELLRLHHIMAVTFVSCCLDATELSYDDFQPQFEDVVRRSRAFATSSSDRTTNVGFTNEAGVLLLLAFAGAKCRAQRVRSEVVELLRRFDWREGSWDSTSLADAVEGLMRLEGQRPEERPTAGPDDAAVFAALPRPEARYTWTNMFWDFENRQMTVEYSKVLPNELGGFDRETRVMSA